MILVNCDTQYWNFVRDLRNDERNQSGFFSFSDITKEQQIKFMEQNHNNYKICLVDGIAVGYVGIINGKEITYCTHHDWKNKGIGTFMVDNFSKNSGVTEAIVKTENIPSQRVFEKLGWEKKILYTKK